MYQSHGQSDRAICARVNGTVAKLKKLLREPWRIATAALLILPLPALAAQLQFTDLSNAEENQVPLNAKFSYNVEVENSDQSNVSNAVAIFDLPVGASFIRVVPLGYCRSEGVNVATRRERIRCDLPPLNGLGAKVNFSLEMDSTGMEVGPVNIDGAIGFNNGSVPAPGTPVASLDVNTDLFFGDDTNKADNKQSTTTAIIQSGDLSLAKTASKPAVIGGEEVTYTLTVNNKGPGASADFRVIDTLPSSVSYVAGSFSGGDWSIAENTPSAGQFTATYAGPALAANEAASFTFRGKVNVGGGTVTNSARVVAGSMPDPNPGNDNASVATTVTAGADMQVAKTATPAPAVAGETVRFNITVTNLGPSLASNPRWSDTLPAGFVITGGNTQPGWNCTTNAQNTTRDCTHAGTLAVGSPVSFWIDATAPANGKGDFTNTATVASDTPDPVAANNNGPVTFSVMPDGADLGLTKSKTPKLVAVWSGAGSDADSLMTSVIQIHNYGPKAATDNVEVVERLALGEEFMQNQTPAAWNCAALPATWDALNPVAQVVTCRLHPALYPLAKDANAPELRLQTRARLQDTNLRNDACTGGTGGSVQPTTPSINKDGNEDNNCAGDAARTTADQVDLEIAKTTNAQGANTKTLPVSADSFSYTLRVTNKDLGAGSVAASGIVVNDAIPGYVPASAGLPATGITATSASGWPCTVTDGSVVCRSGIAKLAVGATEVITINVTRPLMDSALAAPDTRCAGQPPGSFCNTAGVAVDAAVADSIAEVNGTNNMASDWVVVEKRANIKTVSKEITSGTTGQVGVNTDYLMTWINEGPSTVPGVVFRDTFTLPANDTGFVLVSAVRTRQGLADEACSVTAGANVTTTPAAGGTSYSTGALGGTVTIACTAHELPSRYSEDMKVTIRPNSNAGNNPAGRRFDNTADFILAGPASGTGYDYNYIVTPADDTKSAQLTFSAGAAQLFVEKLDRNFTTGVDPLGFDPAGDNFITYRVEIRNAGPSVATAVKISDQYRVPVGRRVQFVGWASGPSTGPGSGFVDDDCIVHSANPFTGAGTAVADASLNITCDVPGAGFSGETGIIGVNATSYIYLRYKYLDEPAPTGETAINSVAVSMAESQVAGGIYSGTQQTTILARADMGVEKKVFDSLPAADPNLALPAAEATEVTLGQPFWWVIEAVNHGPAPSMSLDRTGSSPINGLGTVVTDRLPAGMMITGPITWEKKGMPSKGEAANGTGSCTAPSSPTAAGATITCNLGDVAANGKVRILIPARWNTWPGAGDQTNTASVATEMVDPVTGNNQDDAKIKVVRSTLAGVVFWDKDRSNTAGTQEASDDGIAGVVIRLSGTDAYGNVLGGSTGYIEATTTANGSYLFDNLAPANPAGYTLTQIQPASYVNGPHDPPTDPTTGRSLDGVYAAGATNSANSTYTGIHLAADQQGVRYSFPEVRRPSLSGHVYVDSDYDNVFTSGTDGVIEGATVELLDAAGNVIATTTTNNQGVYTFPNLDPLQVYTLREVLPSGNYRNRPTAVNVGTVDGTASGTASTGIAPDAATTDRISTIDLSSGSDGINYNFGEDALAPISGYVYLDRDDNGSYDNLNPTPGDAPIAGVLITIFEETAPGVWTERYSQRTSADGAYSWDEGLVGKKYQIKQTQPTGLADGQENGSASATPNVVTINALPAAGSSRNNFGELAGSIAGRVWLDLNNNGTIDPGEDGIANVTVSLPAGTLDALGNTVTALTTDANGYYRFSDLLEGGYTVTEQAAQPVVTVAGSSVTTLNGITVAGNIAGTTTGTATSVATLPSAVSAIVLGAGQHSVQNNFGEILPVSISGVVFFDTDNDGTQNGPADVGIRTVNIVLTGTDDQGNPITPITIQTKADGSFEFVGLRPGIYTVTEPTQPTGTINGITTAGTVAGASSGTATPVSTLPSAIAGIDLRVPGSASIGNLFAEIPKNSSIVGRVWMDANDNGMVDQGEDGIAGVIVVLTGIDIAGNRVQQSTTTDGQGRYAFTDLPPGTYTVTEPDQPAGTIDGNTVAGSLGGVATPKGSTPSAISGIVLPANQHSIENNFGEIPTNSSISGRVWLDRNNDGVIGSDETGIAGVIIRLSGINSLGQPVALEVRTDAQGNYLFDGLLPGTYTVTEPEQPSGTQNGKTVAGSSGGSATDPSTAPSAISTIVLAANEHSNSNNFGEIPPGSIAGRVYNDDNDNGQVDPGETGIPNQEIVLEGIDDLGKPVRVTTVTDADGRYHFPDLRPGRYTVTQPNQPPQTQSGKTTAGSTGGTATPKETTPSSISGIDLLSGVDSVDNNFGEVPPSSISGRVYNDDNDNGRVDPGETGIPGQEIVLEGVDDLGKPVRVTTVTDGDGHYHFPNLRPGRYTVTQPNQPPQTQSGKTTAGSSGGIATPKETTPSSISVIELPAGTDSIDNNFGEINVNVPDLRVSKSVSPEVLLTGSTATYRVVVRNAGQGSSIGEYQVSDRLPPGVTLTETPSGDGWTCTGAAGEGRFVCRSASVLAGQQTSTAVINVPVRIGADAVAGTINNAVLVSGGGELELHAPTSEEKQALEETGDVGILPVCEAGVVHNACRLPSELQKAWPHVVVSKAADTPVFTVGEKLNYLIRVRNIGERATDAEYVVNEHLPQGVVLAGLPVGDGWTCTGTAGERRFQCASSRVLETDSIHPGTIKVPVEVLPGALQQGTVNNAVVVSGGGENSERKPSSEQWKQFEETPELLDLCDPLISQKLCRVPNEVKEAPQDAVLVISKRGDRAMAEIGDMVQYSIEVRHVSGTAPRTVNIVDLLPRGFTYIEGSARVDGRALTEPLGRPGPRLGFDLGPIQAGGQLLLTYRVRIGVGALQGDGINRAQAHGCSMATGCIEPNGLSPLPGSVPSNHAEYRVRVTGGVFTDETCVLGKIFVDCNNNHVQDREELGIPGVRLYFSDGTWLISDSEGKYSYCGLPPRSYTLKVDPSTLPVGSRLTTSSNRNLGDADSLFLDLKNGELHRADFIEGSCSNPVLEQVKARRTQGEVRAPETESGKASLRFESKPLRAPQQATDSANQRPIVEPRSNPPSAGAAQEVQP